MKKSALLASPFSDAWRSDQQVMLKNCHQNRFHQFTTLSREIIGFNRSEQSFDSVLMLLNCCNYINHTIFNSHFYSSNFQAYFDFSRNPFGKPFNQFRKIASGQFIWSRPNRTECSQTLVLFTRGQEFARS